MSCVIRWAFLPSLSSYLRFAALQVLDPPLSLIESIDSSITLSQSSFSNGGGVIEALSSTVVITRCNFTNNAVRGFLIHSTTSTSSECNPTDPPSVSISGCFFNGNKGESSVLRMKEMCRARIEWSSFSYNVAGEGAAVSLPHPNGTIAFQSVQLVEIFDCRFEGM